jgi:hypothetical protein
MLGLLVDLEDEGDIFLQTTWYYNPEDPSQSALREL